MKVLIVDDSHDALAVAKARLAKEKIETLCADSGRRGLELARCERPDLVLLDVDMPDLSGFEVCRELKADPNTCMIPVIFLTASNDTRNKVKGLDVGGVDYITKPFDAFELRARVRAVLRTKHLQDLLIRYSHIDPLTELNNRRALMKRLQEEWDKLQHCGGQLSVMMTDIDHFKQINDTYGHLTGDEVIKLVADVLREQCRESDFAARYGGDEFTVLASGIDASQTAETAERCRQAIQEGDVASENESIEISASFGVADAEGLDSLEAFVNAADEALYKAKQQGGNKVEQSEPSNIECHTGPRDSD